MAHWAELSDDNVVLRVVVGDNEAPDEGYAWVVANLGGRWVQTSYNANFRKHYAGVGYTYDEDLDAFIPPQPWPSWLLDEATCTWHAPVPPPTDEECAWDEELRAWVPFD